MQADLHPEWITTGYLLHALAPLEFGDNQDGAHIQYACTVISNKPSADPIINEFKRKMSTFLNQPRFSSDGEIKWQIRKPHEHTDPLYLFGYAWKQIHEPRRVHTRVGQMLTPDYLKAAFKHYRSTAHENEGGEASEKAHAGPGEKRKVPLLTRANLLPEMEYFDHDQGFTPLNLSVAKLASLATSQGFWKPHSMFVSGTTQKPSPVCQNIWFRIRRDRSKAARMDWMNKLLYGPEYGPEDDMAIEQALTAHNDGPAPSVTNPLTYAECVHSIRTGVLPTGQVLQTGLDGYTGRSVLIDLHGCPAAKEVASALGGNEMRTLFAAHLDMQPTASANGSALTAAAAARLLASAAEPFALSLGDVKARHSTRRFWIRCAACSTSTPSRRACQKRTCLTCRQLLWTRACLRLTPGWRATPNLMPVWRTTSSTCATCSHACKGASTRSRMALRRCTWQSCVTTLNTSPLRGSSACSTMPPCAVTAESRPPRSLPRRQARARVLHTKMPFEPPGKDFSHPCYLRA